ncbi:hypothetical protein [Bacillus pumilus]|uniref:hypothetical protein n=1 Tax=Bacillus pumilus TaxID=1408 RepID=UPI002281F9DA|nr:hypothetical protein [Bacillus pumilus]MCY7500101.1 hypothetical protein [Bacillus pumilus]MCY7528575.1 hypothetical protein [Bacillus pumilus]MED4439465.1 hypothetical protein [Bacillus pumilus]MED4489908.1 hypothetical protein [Bacillus pumilus]
MSMMVQEMTELFNRAWQDIDLNRLLYYKDTPLSPDLPNVQELDNYFESTPDEQASIFKTIFKRAAKTNDLTDDKPICRVCIYFGISSPLPPHLSEKVLERDLHFDVYTHIDTFEENEFRSLKIIDRLSKIYLGKNVAGYGKTQFVRGQPIANPPSGYTGYKLIFKIGGQKW